jgi:hypothetical protein
LDKEETEMIYEVRTYTLKPGSIPEVERRWGRSSIGVARARQLAVAYIST